MLIVAGHLVLDPTARDAHVAASAGAVRLARKADGCLDFDRIVSFEVQEYVVGDAA